MSKIISPPMGSMGFSIASLGVEKKASSWRFQTFRKPPSHYTINSLFTNHAEVLPFGVDNNTKMEELREITQLALRETSDTTAILKVVDKLDRMGIGYHFEEEINTILDRISNQDHINEDLFTTSLCFRLLRHNGYQITSNIFRKFMDKNGKLKESLISKDMKGMLSLYEASYLGACGEEILSEAKEFTETRLRSSRGYEDHQFDRQVFQALELPRHLRMARLETRRHIVDEFSNQHISTHSLNSHLLSFAKLDFNRVQSLHQEELAEITRWWRHLGLVDNLDFGRDRPTECYLWTVGILEEPKYSECRIELAKTIAILLVIDDMFDSYGSMDDLVIFTESIQRWDLNAMEELPEYMKICYMALYNTINEIAYKILKKHGWCVIPQLKTTWIDLIEAYLLEAKWFKNGYVPNTEEYLENGVTTAGSYMAIVHIFFLNGEGVTKETIGMLDPYPKLFSNSGRILRLWDDLGTATEEKDRGGNVASSIDCLMREKGLSSEGGAREHIKKLIHNLWKEMNRELMAPKTLPVPLIKAALNMSRTAQVIYQHGDNIKFPSVGDCVKSLFFTPIIV